MDHLKGRRLPPTPQQRDVWNGWLAKVSLKARRWSRKERFFRLVRVAVQGGQDFYEIRYFRGDDVDNADQRLGTINLFNASGVCWFGNFMKRKESSFVICIPTPTRVWFLRGKNIEQITHLTTRLSGILPQISVRGHGIVEIPRKQRFLKMKGDWKTRFVVGLSNYQMLVFNNAKLEEYEGASLLTNYKSVERERSEDGQELLVCASLKGQLYEKGDGSGKDVPSMFRAPTKRRTEDCVALEQWFSLIRQAIAYRVRRAGLSASDLQLVSLIDQIKRRDYRATSHAIHAARIGVPNKLRFKLWCGFSGAERRPRGIFSKIERQQQRWRDETQGKEEKEEDKDKQRKVARQESYDRRKHCLEDDIASRLVDAYEAHDAERKGLSSHAMSRMARSTRQNLTRIACFIIQNLSGTISGRDVEKNDGVDTRGVKTTGDGGDGISDSRNAVGGALEDAAFRVLIALTEDVVPRYFSGLNEHRIDARAFEILVSQRYPPLTEHIRTMGIRWREPASIWFRSMFVDLSSTGVCCRLWDVLMVEGPVVLVRIGIAFVRMRRSDILRLPNVPGSREKALELLDISKFEMSEDEDRALLRYAFHEMDPMTELKLRKSSTALAASSNSSVAPSLSAEGASLSLSSSDGAAVTAAAGRDTSASDRSIADSGRDDLEIAWTQASEIYWDIPRESALFRLLVDGLHFASSVQRCRREEWRKVAHRAQQWQKTCDDMHGLAQEVCVLGSKFSKYATDLAQILLDLMADAHRLPAGYCDERLIPTAAAAANKEFAMSRAFAMQAFETGLQDRPDSSHRGTDDVDSVLLLDEKPQKRVLTSADRLYEIVVRLHRSLVKASGEAAGVKRTQRRWQRELQRVGTIARLASEGLNLTDEKSDKDDKFLRTRTELEDAHRHRRRRLTRHSCVLSTRNRDDLAHLTECAANVDASFKVEGNGRRPQAVVTGLAHALVGAAWSSISACWACDLECHDINYIEHSFLLKEDGPTSQMSPHRKLRKLLVHMRMKFRIVAEEIVQRLQRLLASVWQQLQSARNPSAAGFDDVVSPRRSVGMDVIEGMLPRLLDALSRVSRTPSAKMKKRPGGRSSALQSSRSASASTGGAPQ